MTIGEINLQIETFQEKEKIKAKETLAVNYNLAYMVANFVGRSLNGKKIPSINELYPDTFETKSIEERKQELLERSINDANYIALQKEKLLDFAIARNKQRKVH